MPERTNACWLGQEGRGGPRYQAQIAAESFESNRCLPGFESIGKPVDLGWDSQLRLIPQGGPTATRETTGFLAEADRQVRITEAGTSLHCDFSGIGGLHLDLTHAAAWADRDVPEHLLGELLLGPALLLLLADRGMLGLHASSIQYGDRTILFCADSGSGKSSLAHHARDFGAVALTDDIAPLRIGPVPTLLPRFPQLKWPVPLEIADATMSIDRIVFVERGGTGLACSPIPPVAARLRLIRHTVAARLFPRRLAQWHLDTVGELARRVPMLRLSWPECAIEAIPDQVARALAELSAH